MFKDSDAENLTCLDPSVHVSQEQLFLAIEETEKLTGWLETYMLTKRWGH